MRGLSARFNPFISSKDPDFLKAVSILKKKNPKIQRGFTKEEEQVFYELYKYRIKKNGLVGNFILFILRLLSILLHPLNSWGMPIEIKPNILFNLENYSNIEYLRYFINQLDFRIFSKLLFKILLFLYRVSLYTVLIKYLFYFFKKFDCTNINANIVNKLNNLFIFFFCLIF